LKSRLLWLQQRLLIFKDFSKSSWKISSRFDWNRDCCDYSKRSLFYQSSIWHNNIFYCKFGTWEQMRWKAQLFFDLIHLIMLNDFNMFFLRLRLRLDLRYFNICKKGNNCHYFRLIWLVLYRLAIWTWVNKKWFECRKKWGQIWYK